MRWSRLKQNVEPRFVPSLRGRVEVHVTRYRATHDGEGEFWLTLDGEKIYGAAYYRWLAASQARPDKQASAEDPAKVAEILSVEGLVDHHVLIDALFGSLGQPIDAMLASEHPLIRALAVIDARCGRRRLDALELSGEHALVVRMVALRARDRRWGPDATAAP